MRTREAHAGPEAAPATTEERRVPAAPGGVELLQRTIGNRAVGSLLRTRVLARDLVGKPKSGQVISGDGGQIYEIIRSDFNKALKEWKYTVKGADGKTTTVWGTDSGFKFSSATQLIDEAIAKKKTIRRSSTASPRRTSTSSRTSTRGSTRSSRS